MLGAADLGEGGVHHTLQHPVEVCFSVELPCEPGQEIGWISLYAPPPCAYGHVLTIARANIPTLPLCCLLRQTLRMGA
jgi:hypothetical protein